VRNASATPLLSSLLARTMLGVVSGLAARRFAKQPTLPNLTAPRLRCSSLNRLCNPFASVKHLPSVKIGAAARRMDPFLGTHFIQCFHN